MPVDDKEDNAKLGSEEESKDSPGASNSVEGEHPLDSSGEGDMIRKKPRVNSPRGNSPIGKASVSNCVKTVNVRQGGESLLCFKFM